MNSPAWINLILISLVLAALVSLMIAIVPSQSKSAHSFADRCHARNGVVYTEYGPGQTLCLDIKIIPMEE